MLSYLRKHSKTWFTRLIFGMIIFVFVLWGGSSYMAREANMLAKVDRHIITIEQFEKNYQKAYDALQERFGGSLSPEMLKAFNLKQAVLDDMIDEYVVDQEAARLNISVSDEDLKQAIQAEPAFKTGGSFDGQRYSQILQNAGLTPVEFEARERRQMLMNRLASVVTSGVIITKPEIEAYFHAGSDVFELNFIKLDPAQFVSKVTLKPGELETYFDASRELYKVLPKTTIEYVVFKNADAATKLNVSDADAKTYYDANIERYTTKASAHVRQIMIKIPAGADQAAIKAKQTEAERIFKLAQAGDFAAVAKQYSQDEASAAKGGDLGMIARNSLPDGLGAVVFAMQPGQVKQPVRSSQAFHIFKLESKQDEVIKPFDSLKAQITSEIKIEKAREVCRKQAEDGFNSLYMQASPDLKGFAAKAGLPLQTAGPFFASERPAVLGADKLVPASFTFQPGQMGDMIESPEGYVIYKVTARVPARLPELKEVQARVEQDLKRFRAVALARQEAERLAKLPVASLNAMAPQTTGGFKRSTWNVPNLDGFGKVKDEFDQLGTPRVYEKAGQLAVVWLKGKQSADFSKLTEQEQFSLKRSLLGMKQQQTLKAFVSEARKHHKIVIHKDKF